MSTPPPSSGASSPAPGPAPAQEPSQGAPAPAAPATPTPGSNPPSSGSGTSPGANPPGANPSGASQPGGSQPPGARRSAAGKKPEPPQPGGASEDPLQKLASSLSGQGDPTQTREVLARLADFLQVNPSAPRAGTSPLEFLMDVTVPIIAELGHTTLPIGDVLKLEPGSVVELDRDVTQFIDLTVRGVLFARGEVVVVDDRFAIRIRELVHPRAPRRGTR